MEQYYNGAIKIRNRKVEMKWTGEYATHVLENYNKKDGIHDLKHNEIQQLLKKSKYKKHRKRSYRAIGTYNDIEYTTVFILTNKYAVIKTCYRYR